MNSTKEEQPKENHYQKTPNQSKVTGQAIKISREQNQPHKIHVKQDQPSNRATKIKKQTSNFSFCFALLR